MKPTQPQVLIVDSDPKDVRVLLEVLESVGIDVHVRTNGRSALEAFHEIKPDLVLVDSRMQSGSGKRVSAELAQADQGRPIPVILMTADGSGAAGSATALDTGGCASQLQKPLTRQDLLDTLSRFLPKAFLTEAGNPQEPRHAAPTLRPASPGATARPQTGLLEDEKVLGSLLDKVFPTTDSGDLAGAIVQQVRPAARELEKSRSSDTRPKPAPAPPRRPAPAARDAAAPLADLPIDTIDAMLESIFPTSARREPPAGTTGPLQRSASSSSAAVAAPASPPAKQPASQPTSMAGPAATVEEPTGAMPPSAPLEAAPLLVSPAVAAATEPVSAPPSTPAEPAMSADAFETVQSVPPQEPVTAQVEPAAQGAPARAEDAPAIEPVEGTDAMTMEAAPACGTAMPEPAQPAQAALAALAAPTPAPEVLSPAIGPVRSEQDALPAQTLPPKEPIASEAVAPDVAPPPPEPSRELEAAAAAEPAPAASAEVVSTPQLPATGTAGSRSTRIAETAEGAGLERARGSKRDKKARRKTERDEAARTVTKGAQTPSINPAATAPTVTDSPSAAASTAASETAVTPVIPFIPELGKGLEHAYEKPQLTAPRRRTGRVLAAAGIGLAACATAFFVMSRTGVQRAPQGPAPFAPPAANVRIQTGGAPASSVPSPVLTSTPSPEPLPSLPDPRETGRTASAGEPGAIVAPAERQIASPPPPSPSATASSSRAARAAVQAPAPRAGAPSPAQGADPGPASTPPAPVSLAAAHPAAPPAVSGGSASASSTGSGGMADPGSLSGAGSVGHSPATSTAQAAPAAPATDIAQTQMERAASAASEAASPAPAASGEATGEQLARLTTIRTAEGAEPREPVPPAPQGSERANPFATDVVPFASPIPLRHAPPDYPSMAVSMRQTGSVRLLVKVESDGRVTEVRVTGHATPVLDQAAVRAAYGWSYRPAQQNGQPVGTWVEETVEFKLR